MEEKDNKNKEKLNVEELNDKSFKRKNVMIIIFEVVVILLGILGITLATSKSLSGKSETIITAGKYNLDYVGDKDIIFSNLEPMDGRNVNINTKENVIRLEFSLKGVSTNKDDKLIYDVMLSDMEIDKSLLNEYTKWNLYKNGKLLSTGNLSPSFDGDVLGKNMKLTEIQQDLPKYNENYDKYVLLFWINDSCDDILTCEKIDQSNIIDSTMSMKVLIAVYGGNKKKNVRISNNDISGANKPILANNMIPVTYKNGSWIVAAKENNDKNNQWYDYNHQKWANAIVVKNNYDKYQNVGEKININDVLAYYVWIPRYRYKLWNVESEITDSYNAYDNGIDIIFENGLNTINNDDNYENSKYITHPAFSNNLTGFWINKYEVSKKDNTYYSIPSTIGNYDTLDNYKDVMNKISVNYNLGEKVESHIVNNLEWGAILYLSHSKYGVCDKDGCIKIDNNKTDVSGSNKQDTTTRNVNGVYDMSGGLPEYVIGNYKVGSAINEVFLDNGYTWYGGNAFDSGNDYIIRGGANSGLFYFSDISMAFPRIGVRGVIINNN